MNFRAGLCVAFAMLATMGGLAPSNQGEAAPITWVGGDGDWDASGANWDAASAPTADDEAIFATPNVVNLANSTQSVAALTMSAGSALVTHGNSLDISGSVQLSGAETTLAVSENSSVALGDMMIGSGAQLFMQGGLVESPGGGMIATDATGNIYGYGLINAAVNNSGAITAAGGTLTLANSTFLTDPASTADELRVEPDSTLEIRGTPEDYGTKFNGSLTVNAGTVYMNGASIANSALYQSVYDLTGGTLVQSAGLGWGLDGLLLIRAGADSTLKGPGTFTFGSTLAVQLDSDLRLDADTVIHSGVNWSGSGMLVIMPGRYLTQEGGLRSVRNEGNFFVSAEPIETATAFFEQTSSGRLVLDFGAAGSDELIVYQATLAGDLELRLATGYTPQVGQSFTVLTAVGPTGGYTGTFDHVIQPEGLPPGMMFSVVYGANDVVAYVVPGNFVAADFNHDGQVDGADFSQWASSFGQNDNADANGDGASDGADFLAWQQQAASSGGSNSANVPEPAACVLLTLATGVIARRRLD